MENYYFLASDGELYHYGVKGQKWGVRRYQNKDGSLTAAGKKRLGEPNQDKLEKGDLSLDDRLRLYDRKLTSARSQIRKDFPNKDDIEKQKKWNDESNRAYVKWEKNKDPSKDGLLKRESDRLYYDHPEAIKKQELRDSYVYNNASNRLKSLMDKARANNRLREWSEDVYYTDHEYGALDDAYNRAYADYIYADELGHSSCGHSNEYILTSDGQLYHWGIKGMKWGVRRYQNKDGSLTAKGRKRYNDEVEKLKERERVIKNKERVKARQDKLAAKKAELDARDKALKDAEEAKKPKKEKPAKGKSVSDKKKSISDMTDEELQKLINRARLEDQYKQLRPDPVPQKNKLVSALEPVLIDAGKNMAKDALAKISKKLLGEKMDELTALEREWKKSDYRNKIDENLKKIKDRKEGKSDDDEVTIENAKPKTIDELDKILRIRKEHGSGQSTNTNQTVDDNTESNGTGGKKGKKGKKGKDESETIVETNETYDRTDDSNASNTSNTSKTSISSRLASERQAANEDSYERVSNFVDNFVNKAAAKKAEKDIYGTKAYEKKVDKWLDDMDDDAWALWYSLYGGDG